MRLEDFADAVCGVFGLGSLTHVSPFEGASNSVWRVDASSGAFVIKELPAPDLHTLTGTASFELAVYRAEVVAMAEPIPDLDGLFVCRMRGSGDVPVSVRVHRYVPGQPQRRPPDHRLVVSAGRSLAAIQNFGAGWNSAIPVKQLWQRSTARSSTGSAPGFPTQKPIGPDFGAL